MTHTLHRHGDAASLERDFVVLTLENRAHPAPGLRERLGNRLPRLRDLLKSLYFALRVDRFVNRVGLPGGDVGLDWTKVCHSRDELRDHVERLRRADTGRSVVVSGVFESVADCIGELGLRPHTVQYSLGCFGRTERLPREEILEITTLCGHHLVSPRRVEELAHAVTDGSVSREEAAESLGGLCLCRIFNERRAADLMAGLQK
ncbi:hypothetical protein H8E07_14215 [bacterium]|nr:hypothetical protein [bacterium]